MMRRLSPLVLVVAFGTFACDDSSSPSAPSDLSGPGAAGTMYLRITDSPYGRARAVLVTFSQVAVQRDGSWTTLPFPGGGSTRTCDLKKLQNDAEDLLGSGAITPGQYTMIRFTVQSARIFFDNSAVSATPCAPSIPEPAGASSSLPLSSREVLLNGTYTLTSTAPTTILVDFDGEASIFENGTRYGMNPVIRLVRVQ